MLDNYELADGRSRPKEPSSPALPFADLPAQRSLCSITWNKTPFASFQSGYLKTLDLDRYFQLPTAASKRAFRYLDKHLPPDGTREFDLDRFACQHIGFSPKYKPSRLRQDVAQTVVRPLELAGFIEPMPSQDRFPKRERRYRVVFARIPQETLLAAAAAPAESNGPATLSPILQELKRRGLGGKTARDFVAAHPASYLDEKIDFLDFLSERGEAPNKPAAWLRRPIEQDYGQPPGYLPRAERQRRQQAAEELRQRQEEAGRQAKEAEYAKQRQAEAEAHHRRAHIDTCLAALTEVARQSLVEQALARAEGFAREFVGKPGPAGDAIRQGLIDDEVLRQNPLPGLPS